MSYLWRRNVELKARLADLARARQVASEVGAHLAGTLEQTDTYFNVSAGRLKLRESVPGGAELIAYHRPDLTWTSESRYDRQPVERPDVLLWQLSSTLGVRVCVRKQRELWLMEHVRIHLDAVCGVGAFLELEVAVVPGHDELAAERQADDLAHRFGIAARDVVVGSYADLLANTTDDPSRDL
jgi:predicted adenylyl cyclase CyaB